MNDNAKASLSGRELQSEARAAVKAAAGLKPGQIEELIERADELEDLLDALRNVGHKANALRRLLLLNPRDRKRRSIWCASPEYADLANHLLDLFSTQLAEIMPMVNRASGPSYASRSGLEEALYTEYGISLSAERETVNRKRLARKQLARKERQAAESKTPEVPGETIERSPGSNVLPFRRPSSRPGWAHAASV